MDEEKAGECISVEAVKEAIGKLNSFKGVGAIQNVLKGGSAGGKEDL